MAGFSKLCKAVGRNDIIRVRRLVREGTDVNGRDDKGRTVLHHATEKGRTSMVECLLELSACVNAVDNDKRTPLHYALSKEATEYIRNDIIKDGPCTPKSNMVCKEERDLILGSRIEKRKVEIVDCLSKRGADINARFASDVSLIHDAVKSEDILAVDRYIRQGVDVNAEQKTGWTGLNLAASLEETVVIKHLVKLGADINSTFDQTTALYDAVTLGRCDIVKILVKNGAAVGAKNYQGVTILLQALWMSKLVNNDVCDCLAKLGANLDSSMVTSSAIHKAVKLNQTEILECLIKDESIFYSTRTCAFSMRPLALAVLKDEYDIVQLICNQGADINACIYRCTPLFEAVRQGHVEMVKSLVKLGVGINSCCNEGVATALRCALVVVNNINMVSLLLKSGANVNGMYDTLPILHDVIKRCDKEMVQELANLGADLNCPGWEGKTVIDDALACNFEETIVKALIKAGADLNTGWNQVTALHQAVRLSDTGMVETLARLNADMNCGILQGSTLLLEAVTRGRTDIVESLVQHGANIDARYVVGVRPLHDAVQQGNTEMVNCLVKCGADASFGRREGLTAMFRAISQGDINMIKYLVDLGANVNAIHVANISPLQDAVTMQHSNSGIVQLLSNLRMSGTYNERLIWSILDASISFGMTEITEYLLTLRIDNDCKEAFGDVDFYDQVGKSHLHRACKDGNIDLARLLLINGSDVNRSNRRGKLPLEVLPLAKTVDYHVLHEIAATEKIIGVVGHDIQPVVFCQDIKSLHCTPGIGNVLYNPCLKCIDISESVHAFLQHVLKHCDKVFSGEDLDGCGSAAEGTKVGLPNEMDFLFEVSLSCLEEANIRGAGNGYIHYKCDRSNNLIYGQEPTEIFKEGSRSFHQVFATEVQLALHRLQSCPPIAKISIRQYLNHTIIDANRKACTAFLVKWEDGQTNFVISVDAVPCLHVDNWPDGAVTRTWLMDHRELKNHGYNLVPKPPNLKSPLAKQYTTEELEALWRISFSHLETKHMQRLEKRVKDVYVTAKCLRTPDVCRIMVTDEGSLPRNVDRYITSYLLKMTFFKNVEDFLNSDLSLGEMVCKVYDDLVDCLSRNYIPLFFMPTVNVLDGLKLDVSKCTEVAKIMKSFVRALYLRDCQEDPTDYEYEGEVIIYQRKPRSVYRSIEISSRLD